VRAPSAQNFPRNKTSPRYGARGVYHACSAVKKGKAQNYSVKLNSQSFSVSRFRFALFAFTFAFLKKLAFREFF